MEGVHNMTMEVSGIVEEAQQYLAEFIDQNYRPGFVFHNYALIYNAVEQAQAIIQAGEYDPETIEVTLLSCWLLKTGLWINYEQPVSSTLREAGKFFVRTNYPEEKRKRVVQCLQTVANKRPPLKEEERIVTDAYTISEYLLFFEEKMALLRLEEQILLAKEYDDANWQRLLKEKLHQVRLYTTYAKINYAAQQGQYLLQLQQKINKKEKKESQQEETALYKSLEKGIPNRGAQTFFRANYRNHINLSSIADNKANIMISVNSILISILITFISYRNISETNPMILVPVTLFLVTGLASLIFAVLSARPKVTKHSVDANQKDMIKKNIVFFGNFSHLPIETYEDAMDEVLRDDALLYGNMVRDLYYLGKVLDQKYRYLSISYNIFMMGFIITVGSFLFVIFG